MNAALLDALSPNTQGLADAIRTDKLRTYVSHPAVDWAAALSDHSAADLGAKSAPIYRGHTLVATCQCGLWLAKTDQYDGPADPGTLGGINNLCVSGDTESEAQQELMNAIDLELQADEKAEEDEDDCGMTRDEIASDDAGQPCRGEL